MALEWLISYAFVMSLFFIGSTYSCENTALQNCVVAAYGTADQTKLRLLAFKGLAFVCSKFNHFKDCADSAYCSSEVDSIFTNYGLDRTLCDKWRNNGSTNSCEYSALPNCIATAFGPAYPTHIRSMASKDQAVFCSQFNYFKDCADSAYCSSELDSLISYFGVDKTLCDEWRNNGSAHSCDNIALQNCLVTAFGTADQAKLLSLASQGPAFVCSKFNHFKDCADSANCSSELNYFISSAGGDKTLCEEWRNKGVNGVSTLTPRLTFMMVIVFLVMTFTRLMK